MPSQITNYQCPACTGPLHFDGAKGKLSCEYCGSEFTVQEIEALYEQKNEQAEQAAAQQAAKDEAAAQQAAAEAAEMGGEWDTSDMSGDWGADAEGMKAYNCPSCGAELMCEASTAATSCPYCGNPTIVPSQFSGTLKPDVVIPFKLSREEAVTALKKHYKGKKLLPKSFTDANHIEEIKGVYVPFWLFDGDAYADMEFDATRSHITRLGNEEITTTEHFRVRRAGTVSFEKIPVDASSKMPDAHMDAIEPFDYSELKPFSKAYMPGFLADIYDVSAEKCSARADERATNSAVEIIRSSVTGYQTCVTTSKNVSLRRGKVRYAMLPVWMLSTRYKGQSFLFAMNGQTGKLIGDLPVSKGRYWAWFFGIAGSIAVVMAALLFL